MVTWNLSDPSLPGPVKKRFRYSIGQRVCRIDENANPKKDESGKIIAGLREESSVAPNDEQYKVKMDSGQVVTVRVSQITAEPSNQDTTPS